MSMVLKSAIALAALTSLAGCAAVTPGATPAAGTRAPGSIAISVGPCFGFCPVYDAKVAADGTISFTGTRHTAVLGPRERRASPDTYQKLQADLAPFRPAAGGTTQVPCAVEITDMAAYTITWTDENGREAVTTHQGGCREGAGHDLDTVLRALPERLGIQDWAKQTTRPGVSRG